MSSQQSSLALTDGISAISQMASQLFHRWHLNYRCRAKPASSHSTRPRNHYQPRRGYQRSYWHGVGLGRERLEPMSMSPMISATTQSDAFCIWN